MGINNLAVQTFSSSGSQSVSRANKADSSKQITSDFIARPPIKYINGSGISVIPGTFTRIPQSLTNGAANPAETFNIPNNIDAISDMVLSMELNITPPTSGGYLSGGIYYSKTFLLDLIDKIEIKLAGLNIQTIYPGDIYMRNYSELGTVISDENSFNIIRDASYIDTGSIIGHTTTSGETINFSLSVPFIGRSSDKDRSFLQTGSFTKNLAVTVTYNKIFDSSGISPEIIPLLDCSGTGVTVSVATSLTILSHIITDTEKNYIKQNIINRVINTSAGIIARQIQERFIRTSTGTTAIDIDLDSIDLNVTHLLFCLNVNIFNQDSSSSEVAYVPAIPEQFARFNDNREIPPGLIPAQYVTGANRLSSSWGRAYLDSNISEAAESLINPDVLGVFKGWLSSAELVLGNETTGQIPCTALNSNKVEFNLQNINENFYILKIADNAFSSAGIPFSRIKNKRLILNVRNRFFSSTEADSFVTPDAGDDSTLDTPSGNIGAYIDGARRDATISVCACGTTLQIINNNTISFSYI